MVTWLPDRKIRYKSFMTSEKLNRFELDESIVS